jgi:hypothetical protein
VELADVYIPDLVQSAGAAAGLEADRLVSAIDDDLTLLRTDSEKTQRILTNLLENANKHSPPDQTVEVTLVRRDGSIELSVLDRGPGMPAEFAPRAFEKAASYRPRHVDRGPAGGVVAGDGVGGAAAGRGPRRAGPLSSRGDDVGPDRRALVRGERPRLSAFPRAFVPNAENVHIREE